MLFGCQRQEMTDVQLPRLYERDIDVLLQEELVFNRKVCEVISEALRLKGALCVQQCRLSVVDQTGETDLFAHFSIGDQQGVLLIENKIDAAFQPRQPERYRERAAKLARESECFCGLHVDDHLIFDRQLNW